MLKLHGYKKCSSCRKAESFFQQANIVYTFIDITENGLTAGELAEITKLSGLPLKKLFNTSGEQYRKLKIKELLPRLTDEDILDLLAGNGRLIKRPVVTNGKKATVGFREDLFVDTWR
jgi:arsenate reductase